MEGKDSWSILSQELLPVVHVGGDFLQSVRRIGPNKVEIEVRHRLAGNNVDIVQESCSRNASDELRKKSARLLVNRLQILLISLQR